MPKIKLLLPLFLAIFLMVFNLFVYTPHIIYFSQTEYFEHGFIDLVATHFFIGLILSLVITITLKLLPFKLLKFIVALLVTFSILMWLQADYFAISYGVLDGTEINFAAYHQRGQIELIVVILALILSLVFHQVIIRNSVFILSIINLGLIGMVLFKVITQPITDVQDVVQEQEFNNYSSAKNVIVIVLDNFGEAYFQRAIKDEPDFIKSYDGFVSYTDAISNYSATTGSVPSMLTGEMLPNNTKYREYLRTEVATKGMPKYFEQKGYEVSMISSNSRFKDIYPKRFMSHPEVDAATILNHQAKKLLDYAVFRVVLHQFKPSVFNDGEWLFSRVQSEINSIPNTYSERGKVVLDYIIKNAVLADEQPRFKFLHATIPHPEYIYAADCKRIGNDKTRSSDYKMLEQSKCTLRLLGDLLAQYKSLGIYDNSLIVVTSDHGARIIKSLKLAGFPSDFELNASGIVFMIKGVGQKEPFYQVGQPFSLLKLSDALKEDKLHATKYDQMHDENRLFYAYRPKHKSAKGYLQAGPLYQVAKNHRLPESWKLLEISTNNCVKQTLPIKMTFARSNSQGYCGAFWFTQPGKKNGIWTKGDDNRVVFGLNKNTVSADDEVILTLNYQPRLHSREHTLNMKIQLNGNFVGEKVIDAKGEQSVEFTVDKAYLVDGQNEIQILLPNVKSGKELNVNNSKSKFGVLIESIILD